MVDIAIPFYFIEIFMDLTQLKSNLKESRRIYIVAVGGFLSTGLTIWFWRSLKTTLWTDIPFLIAYKHDMLLLGRMLLILFLITSYLLVAVAWLNHRLNHYIKKREADLQNDLDACNNELQQKQRLLNTLQAYLAELDANAAYSGPNRPPIPEQSGHPFRFKSATHSGAKRPPVPAKPATCSGKTGHPKIELASDAG